jgi:hypothetical protein
MFAAIDALIAKFVVGRSDTARGFRYKQQQPFLLALLIPYLVRRRARARVAHLTAAKPEPTVKHTRVAPGVLRIRLHHAKRQEQSGALPIGPVTTTPVVSPRIAAAVYRTEESNAAKTVVIVQMDEQ